MTFSITVTGKVQGVFYRASTRDKARSLGLKGFVKNQSDGSVYIEATGTADQLNELVAWCRQGPRHATVDNVLVAEIESKQFEAFEIAR